MISLVALASVQLLAFPGNDAAREALPQRRLRAVELPAGPVDGGAPPGHRLVVKFADGVRARADGGGGLTSRSGADLEKARAIADTFRLEFSPAIGLLEERLAELEQRAARRSGRAQPDLAGLVRVDGEDVDPDTLLAAGGALSELPEVEFTWLAATGQPPPSDPAPATPDLTPKQEYHELDPGLGFALADLEGWTGAGVRVSDCEYGWLTEHEDLAEADVVAEPGQTPADWVFEGDLDDHGTAALGILAAADNGYGCTGLVPGATFATYPEWTKESGERRVECIASAIADSQPGDVVLLEMQTSAGGFFDYVPAEYDPDVFLVVRVGTDAGVVVVGSAGNGGVDLDAPEHAGYAAMGSSGAILVGAGTPTLSHDALPYSTHGDRIDLQGWGQDVFSLGYGDFATYGADPLQTYTQVFSGTSSAAALVTAAAAVVQEKAWFLTGEPLAPAALRNLLVATAIPQGEGPTIGPFPDVLAALVALGPVVGGPPPFEGLGGALAGTNGEPQLAGTGAGLPGSEFALEVSGALEGAPLVEVVGLEQADLPFLGGLLVPTPDFVRFGLSTDAHGGFSLSGTFGLGIAPGTLVFVQYWIVDPGAQQGMAATNGLKILIS